MVEERGSTTENIERDFEASPTAGSEPFTREFAEPDQNIPEAPPSTVTEPVATKPENVVENFTIESVATGSENPDILTLQQMTGRLIEKNGQKDAA